MTNNKWRRFFFFALVSRSPKLTLTEQRRRTTVKPMRWILTGIVGLLATSSVWSQPLPYSLPTGPFPKPGPVPAHPQKDVVPTNSYETTDSYETRTLEPYELMVRQLTRQAIHMAGMLCKRGLFEQADYLLRRVQRLNPQDPEVHHALAAIRYMGTPNWKHPQGTPKQFPKICELPGACPAGPQALPPPWQAVSCPKSPRPKGVCPRTEKTGSCVTGECPVLGTIRSTITTTIRNCSQGCGTNGKNTVSTLTAVRTPPHCGKPCYRLIGTGCQVAGSSCPLATNSKACPCIGKCQGTNPCCCAVKCECGPECTCEIKCRCGEACPCVAKCACGDSCACKKECACGDSCQCKKECACGSSCQCKKQNVQTTVFPPTGHTVIWVIPVTNNDFTRCPVFQQGLQVIRTGTASHGRNSPVTISLPTSGTYIATFSNQCGRENVEGTVHNTSMHDRCTPPQTGSEENVPDFSGEEESEFGTHFGNRLLLPWNVKNPTTGIPSHGFNRFPGGDSFPVRRESQEIR